MGRGVLIYVDLHALTIFMWVLVHAHQEDGKKIISSSEMSIASRGCGLMSSFAWGSSSLSKLIEKSF